MGKIEVFQPDRADVIIVIDTVAVRMGVTVLVRPGVRFNVVPLFHLHRFREDVLLFKQHLKIALYFIQGELSLVERRKDGQQHIRVMLNVIQIVVILVIVMGLLIGIQILPQLVLQGTVGGLRAQQVRILGEIGGGQDVGHSAAEHGGTGLQQPHQQDQHKANAAHKEKELFVPCNELTGFLCRLRTFLRALCRGLRRLRCCAGGTVRCPVRRRILLLQPFLLPQAGNGITGRKLGIVMERLLVKVVRVGPDCRLLRQRSVPPGFQLTVRPPVLKFPVPIAHRFLRASFHQMTGFYTRIFLLHLPHLRVGGMADLLQGTVQWILGRMGGRRLVCLPENQLCAAGSGFLVKNALRSQNALFGNGGPCRVQLIRRLVGTVHILFQGRVCPFLLGELQPGRWTVLCRPTLPVGPAPVPALFLFTFVDTPVIQTVDSILCQRRRITGGGIVLLRGTV